MMETGLVVFWAVAGAMALAVATILILALRKPAEAAAPPGAEDLRVYRDQLAEIDRDLARGVLPEEEAARLRTEVSRRLIEADRAGTRAQAAAPGRAALWPVAAVGAAVAGAIALYAEIGVPGYPDIPLAARLAEADARLAGRPSQAEAVAAAPAPQASPAADPEFLALMEKLRAAVASRPDDLRGLELLARNEAGLGNLPAAEAAQRALIVARGASATAEDHAGLAEIMIRAAGGFVSPEAEAELTRALTLDPRNGAARYYAGLMFAQAGRYDRAFALWRPLYEESPPEAPWMAGLAAELPGLAQLAGVAWTPPEARTPGPDAAAIAAAEGMSPEERQAMIEGMVAQLSDRLATEGGSTEDWARLIRALGVLERREQAQAIYDEAKVRFAGRDADLSFLGEAALEAGLTP